MVILYGLSGLIDNKSMYRTVTFLAENSLLLPQGTESLTISRNRVILLSQGTESFSAIRNRVSYCLEEHSLLLPEGT